MRPSLRQLEYLVAVADTLHFRRAAESVHVSQPGLSAQIQELERLLGVRLFERDRRRVLATEAGLAAAARARRVLAEVDRLVETARGHSEPLTGTLRIGVIPTVAPYLLPRALPAIRRAFPRLRALLHEDETPRLVEQLEDGSLDVLLLAMETDLGDAERRPLFSDAFLLAVPPGHRFATRRRLRESDLHDEELLLLEDGH